MKRRTVGILKWTGIIAIVLGMAYGWLHIVASRALQREYDALRAAGGPVRLDEIVPRAIPMEDNAALVYDAAIRMLEAESPIDLDGDEPSKMRNVANLFQQLDYVSSDLLANPTNRSVAVPLARLLQEPPVRDFIASIERGSRRSGYWQALDYSQGAGILLPHMADLRALSRILSALARQQAAGGDFDAAWRTALTNLRVVDSLREEVFVVSQLVRVAQSHMATSVLRSLADLAPPSVADSLRIERMLESFDSLQPLVRSLDGERLVFGKWAFKAAASDFSEFGSEFGGVGFRSMFMLRDVIHPLVRLDQAAYLRVMNGYRRNATEPYAPGDREFAERMLVNVPWYGLTTRVIVPALNMYKSRYWVMVAQARITRVGLAAIRFKRERGVFPPDLAALELADTDDPFGGRPLIYRVADRGFTIYSIGANLTDDGGTEAEDRYRHDGDIVWRHEARVSTVPSPQKEN